MSMRAGMTRVSPCSGTQDTMRNWAVCVGLQTTASAALFPVAVATAAIVK